MREPRPQRNPRSAPAFSLVEIMVAVSVLILLLVLVTQLVNSASTVTSQSGKHLDADSQARLLFDRMAVDFSNMVQRPDVDALFYKATGDDKMFFFSQAPAYYDSSIADVNKSNIALVGYRVVGLAGDATNNAPPFSIERLGKGLLWSGAADPSTAATTVNPGSLVFNSGVTTLTNLLASTWADIGAAPHNGGGVYYHVVADQVFRLEICFQVKDVSDPASTSSAYSNYPLAVNPNSATNNPPTITSGPPGGGAGVAGDRWYDTNTQRAYICLGPNAAGVVNWQPNGLKDVLSVVVTIALLDNTSRKMPPSDLTTLSGLFSDPSETGDLQAAPPRLPAQIWNDALQTAIQTNAAGIPKAAAAQVRIYQRYFHLN